MLDENFVPKIGDFGLTRIMPDDKTTMLSTTNIGTPVYMAPETQQLGEITQKADAFSFGVVSPFGIFHVGISSASSHSDR